MGGVTTVVILGACCVALRKIMDCAFIAHCMERESAFSSFWPCAGAGARFIPLSPDISTHASHAKEKK